MTNPGRSGAVEYQRVIEIDGDTYKIISLSPSKAINLSMRLSRYVAEAFASFAAIEKDGSNMADILPKAVKALMNNMTPDEATTLFKELAATCEYGGELITKDKFDAHFQGRLSALITLMGKVLEFQVGDFFTGIGQAISGAVKQVTKIA